MSFTIIGHVAHKYSYFDSCLTKLNGPVTVDFQQKSDKSTTLLKSTQLSFDVVDSVYQCLR